MVQSLDRCGISVARAAARARCPDWHVLPRRLTRLGGHRPCSAGSQCRALPARSRALPDLDADLRELHEARAVCRRTSEQTAGLRAVGSYSFRASATMSRRVSSSIAPGTMWLPTMKPGVPRMLSALASARLALRACAISG